MNVFVIFKNHKFVKFNTFYITNKKLVILHFIDLLPSHFVFSIKLPFSIDYENYYNFDKIDLYHFTIENGEKLWFTLIHT